jgi:hypothetical protein
VTQIPLFGAPQTQETRDDYYTPPHVFERMGITFDLDVCAPPSGCPWIPADRYFTMEDDGLAQEWTGRVWMNPPYSNATAWVRRFMDHGNGIALVGHAKSAWHNALWKDCDGAVVPDSYFDFVGGSIFMPVWFAAYGEECVEAIGRLGTVRRVA